MSRTNSFSVTPYFLLVIFVAFISPTNSNAETRYVSDFLLINLRSSVEPPYSTVARIKTGDALEILAETQNYYKVKTNDNNVGWVSKKYTTHQTPKDLIIKELEEKISAMEGADQEGHTLLFNENEELKSKLLTAKDDIATLEKVNQELTALNESLKTVDPDKYHAMSLLVKDLQEQKIQIQDKLVALEANNKKLKNYDKIYWFVAGAFVFLVGLLIGKFPTKRQKKTLSF